MRKYNIVIQDGIKDCGASCLLMLIRYYKGDVPKEYLRSITGTTNNGVNALSLIGAGKKIGFESKGVHGDVININDEFLPCIAHVLIDEKYKHYVVIYEINKKKDYIVIGDPAKGLIKMRIDSFRKISTQNFLFFHYIKKIPKIKKDNKIKELVIRTIYDNKNIVVLSGILSILFIICSIITSYNMEFIIDKSLNFNSRKNLYFIMLLLIFIYSLKGITEYYRNLLINFFNHKLDYNIFPSSFYHILSLPYLYYKNRTTGEVITRLNDLNEVKNFICNAIITFLIDILMIITSIIFLFILNKKITILTIIICLLYVLTKLVINRFLESSLSDLKDNNSTNSSYMIELINGVNTIRGINIIDKVSTKFLILFNKLLSSNYSYNNLLNVDNTLTNTFYNIIYLVIIFISSKEIIVGNYEISKLITYNALLIYFFDPIKNILNLDFSYRKARIVIERINELLLVEEEPIYTDDKRMTIVKGDIKIQNLSYSYDDKNYLIKDFTSTIKEGEKVIVCAPSGYGKSTLAKLIVRYLEVPSNTIFIGDKDINDYNLWILRENVTYVSQDEFIFTDTIYNNLTIKNTCDDEVLEKTCKNILVDEIVKDRETNLNMLLEENGSNISGGERQRILLARALLKNSNIYILDESFSEIDVERERKIIKNIKKNYKDKTFIVISHRYDNNDLYDKVINLKESNGN